MYSKALLTGALMATSVSATFMAHQEMKRELLQPRQTATDSVGGISTECQTALLDIYSSLPSPPPEILSDAVENPQTDPCSFSTPASLSKEYASYSSEVVSWYSENSDEISSVLSECPILSQYATMVPVCETGAAGGDTPKATDASSTGAEKPKNTGASASEASKATGTSGSGGAATTSGAAVATTTPNSGNRETGMAIAAMAIAGIVVAAL